MSSSSTGDNSQAENVKIHSKIIKHKGGSELTRDDFDDGPVSLDEIEEGLWLGNLPAATDVPTLNKHNITHILTLDCCPLPRKINELSQITTKFVHIADIPKEDILCHFEDCYTFIQSGKENGNVLVHCYFGISRSSTIVIAYMMKSHNLNYNEAFELVLSKRRFVCPNPGFAYQLKLYKGMNCSIDKSNSKYRDFRLKVTADHVKKVKIVPQSSLDLIKPDPGVTQVKPEPLVYRCKKCRRILASQSNIISHYDRDSQLKYKIKQKEFSIEKAMIDSEDNDDNLVEESESDVEVCQKTYFVEPIAWMKDVSHNTQGKLFCPKCNNKVGSFSWIMGCQCPCGKRVSPAFYFIPSKVEWSNVVQNVQITV